MLIFSHNFVFCQVIRANVTEPRWLSWLARQSNANQILEGPEFESRLGTKNVDGLFGV